MMCHRKLLVSATMLGLAGLLSHQAQAGLLGAGTTVQAFFVNGPTPPQGLIPVGASTADPTSLVAAVNYPSDVDGAALAIADTQIVITNTFSGIPFCFSNAVGAACADVFTGFDFKFTGENILGVSAAISSAPDLLPVTGTFQGNTHRGLQLLSNNEVQVDLTGDLPNLGDQLILDLAFATVSPPPLPVTEPGTLTLLGSVLIGLIAVRRRRPS